MLNTRHIGLYETDVAVSQYLYITHWIFVAAGAHNDYYVLLVIGIRVPYFIYHCGYAKFLKL